MKRRLSRRRFGGEGAFGSGGRLLTFGDGLERRVSRRSGVIDGGTFGRLMLLRLDRKFWLGGLRLSSVIRGLRKLVLCRFRKSVVGRWSFCPFGGSLFGGERFALHDVAIPIPLGAAVAVTAAAASSPTLGFGVSIALVALFLSDQRLPVSDRDLVIVRVNFRECEETVAVAAIVHKRRL